VASALSLFARDALLSRPDSDFKYSTFGYTLVSAVIEGASGTTFLDALRAELTEPLGMRDTEADAAGREHPMRSTEYVVEPLTNRVRRAPATNSSYKWAGGGLLSSPSDLVQFGAALLDNRIVSADSRDEMFTARTLATGATNPQRYGLGWRVGAVRRAGDTTFVMPMMHHGGTGVGSEAAIVLLPRRRIVVAITGNAYSVWIGCHGAYRGEHRRCVRISAPALSVRRRRDARPRRPRTPPPRRHPHGAPRRRRWCGAPLAARHGRSRTRTPPRR
jgi:serine beta-lactamase-like protein LACTB